MEALTVFAQYTIPPGGAAIALGLHHQVRYVQGTVDTIKVRHGGETYTLTRGGWMRGASGEAILSVDSTTEATVSLELGLRQVDAVPLPPPARAVTATLDDVVTGLDDVVAALETDAESDTEGGGG